MSTTHSSVPATVNLTLPDGSVRAVAGGTTGLDVAKSIGAGLARAALAIKLDGKTTDLSRPITKDAALEIVTSKSADASDVIRHSTAHVLAMAVQKLWPGTQVTIGPVIENGFYYDFSFPAGVKISETDLEKIEKEMTAICKADHLITREVVARKDAVKTFSDMGEAFKVEIIKDLPEGEDISVYKMGGWFDLCVGPHVPATGKLGAFKLTAVAGSYWRGDEKNPQLTRIYGTAWPTKEELDAYLHRLEEAKKRDHRVVGKQLGLFSMQREAPAAPFFHPKGTVLLNQLFRFMRKSNADYGFEEVSTPLIMDVGLWHKSGHYENFRENMYFTKVDEDDAAVKPMNCPGHCLIYANERRSYRDLPVRFSEFGRVHRHERSGVTHGIMRVRSFVQDDAHVFCTADQISSEVDRLIEQIDVAYKRLGFQEYKVVLALRPEKRLGSDEIWDRAEKALSDVLKSRGLSFKVAPGEGAFYGPKIEFHLVDTIGRTWQCGTIQLDFSMPARFELEFQGSDDKPHTPVMIHRAVLGSMERFMGIFIEQYAGHFPIWAAPVQARVVTVTEAQNGWAEKVHQELKAAGLRVELDIRREKLGFKIREAQLQKVPWMIVIGDKEVTGQTVAPRFHDGSTLEPMSTRAFIDKIIADCGPQWGI